MKHANKMLTFVMIGNIVFMVISLLMVVVGGAYFVLSDEMFNQSGGLLSSDNLSGWQAMAGFGGMLGGVFFAMVGFFIMLIGFWAFIMYGVPAVMAVVTRIRAKRMYALDVEKCRIRFKTIGIVATVMDSIPAIMIFAFVVCGGYVRVVIFIPLFLMVGLIVAAVLLIVSTKTDSWYTYRVVDKQSE